MKRNIFSKSMIFLSAITAFVVSSCDDGYSNFTSQGGGLTTSYVYLLDGSVQPTYLKVATGTSITFVNNSGQPHTIISDDTTTIRTNLILPAKSFLYKKDTFGVFQYHCKEHPTVTGTIEFRP
jgi:plastocyanin